VSSGMLNVTILILIISVIAVMMLYFHSFDALSRTAFCLQNRRSSNLTSFLHSAFLTIYPLYK